MRASLHHAELRDMGFSLVLHAVSGLCSRLCMHCNVSSVNCIRVELLRPCRSRCAATMNSARWLISDSTRAWMTDTADPLRLLQGKGAGVIAS